MKGSTWEKFTNPSAARSKTAYPKTSADNKKKERLGIRFDYDTEVTKSDGTVYHMFNMQPNAGKIPSSIKAWRDKHGTHAVMAKALIKKGGTMEDVETGLQAAREAFKNT